MNNTLYLQYGSGFSCPTGWMNYDISMTLRIQKVPLLGKALLRIFGKSDFPGNIRYGDIVAGLPVGKESCDGIYCSHVLEHLAFDECEIALSNTHSYLKPGGTFRLVVPDLEHYVNEYVKRMKVEDQCDSASVFMTDSGVGRREQFRGIIGIGERLYARSQHLWMWDYPTMRAALSRAGFKGIRKCAFNDGSDRKFLEVEDETRFKNALAIESIR